MAPSSPEIMLALLALVEVRTEVLELLVVDDSEGVLDTIVLVGKEAGLALDVTLVGVMEGSEDIEMDETLEAVDEVMEGEGARVDEF